MTCIEAFVTLLGRTARRPISLLFTTFLQSMHADSNTPSTFGIRSPMPYTHNKHRRNMCFMWANGICAES